MAQLSRLAQQRPHPTLLFAQLARQIAHPPRLVAEQRFDARPQRRLFGAERQTVFRQVQPAARIAQCAGLQQPIDHHKHQRFRLLGQGHAPQTGAP